MSDNLKDMETLQYKISAEYGSSSSGLNIAKLVPALVIQSHPILERIGDICWMNDLPKGQVFRLGRNHPDFQAPKSVIGTPLSDPYLSRNPIQFSKLPNGQIKLDCVESNIRVFANNMSITTSTTFTEEQVSTGVVIELNERITLLLKSISQKRITARKSYQMVGISPQLEGVREQLDSLSGIDEPVLIRGATGAGKELVAEALYQVSNRVSKPFVKVNLGAIPSSLAAAELFGTKKGAFTGAEKDRVGFFVTANGGTLFLDEIGEAPAEVQSLLLRVLETGELYPVGSNTPRQVNVRIIAATDAHLESMGKEKQFKLPLLHRLASYEINLPSLNERKEDIGLLFLLFAKQQITGFEQQCSPTNSDLKVPWVPTKLMRYLANYHWPGNIRQLKNVVRQLIIDSGQAEQLIMSDKLENLLSSNESSTQKPDIPAKPKRRKPNTVSSEELINELANNSWEIQATAKQLNISRTSIYELMKRAEIRSTADYSQNELAECYYHCNHNLEKMVTELKISKHSLARRLKDLGLRLTD